MLSKALRVARVIREISNVSEDIQNGADAESKWSSNLECAHRIFDVIHNIIDNGPSSIRVDNFKHCGSILVIVEKSDELQRALIELTSLPLWELPANELRKLA